ncbi:GAF and ANTAR domain-containing protein [Arthrobacter sp. NPDC089319]|uniref:GAF and ANTAR domain-containing protein n=1 Tax=Arthrobacter sp. NPDC089319 TaxID=3155915 RepID=UPI00343322D5
MSEAELETQLVDAMQDALLNSDDLQDFLDQLAQHAAAVIDERGEVTCSVLVLRGPRDGTVSATYSPTSPGNGPTSWAEYQPKYDDGPGLSALRSGAAVLVPDVGREQRWNDVMADAASAGIGSILAVPLRVDDGGLGAVMSCYQRRGQAFSEAVLAAVSTYARLAAKPLLLAERLDRMAKRTAHLVAALESRTTINLAAGIVMGQNSCSQMQAMEILRRASNARNVKLRDVAQGIVEPLAGAATRFED